MLGSHVSSTSSNLRGTISFCGYIHEIRSQLNGQNGSFRGTCYLDVELTACINSMPGSLKPCKDSHYHPGDPIKKESGTPAIGIKMGGALKRIADKVLKCKASRLIKCDTEDCNKPHFHLPRDRKSVV